MTRGAKFGPWRARATFGLPYMRVGSRRVAREDAEAMARPKGQVGVGADHPFGRLRVYQQRSHNRRMGPDESEFALSYDDYSESCRATGVEPLSLDALQQLIAALTEDGDRRTWLP